MKHSNRIWFLMGKQLSHSITPAEDQELKTLLTQDPELWYSYELIQAVNNLDDVTNEFIDEIKLLLDNRAPEQLNGALLRRLEGTQEPEAPRPRKHVPFLKIAAAAVGMAVLAWGGFALLKPGTGSTTAAINEITAPKGSKTQITLADGTEIWLNAGSRLTYPKNFSLENRVVTLTGEAYFKVVHHDKYAFVVHTPQADIRDLGTTFNVKAYEGGATTETTLIEGALEVLLKRGGGRKVLLSPNEKVVVYHKALAAGELQEEAMETQKVVPFQATNDIVETAWIDNKLIFRNERFDNLAAMMERRYNASIMIKNEDIRAWQLTGIFKNESLEEALKVLQVIAPFKFTIDHDTVTITR
ncbi:FecR family protein [Chitinophaga alhagiae]|uniref:FecR family protein n=1 Tax=Chitinophaga alhagiae TaxID=2203219 RepID=UPI000E5C0294|nr:FecR domain-containing protein [Chitinophaga alhagiae]